ncbi:MAG: type II toxin-antitoxin system VapC family toxin [Rhodocyclaceae bacterium]|nr:type II toxin-antitoxin system VapC family toxin [Rhodocyclaceae bacterium]
MSNYRAVIATQQTASFTSRMGASGGIVSRMHRPTPFTRGCILMSARILLDTNILSHLIKNPQGVVTQHLAKENVDEICTSIIVACELRYGAAKRASPVLIQRVEDLLVSLAVLPFDSEADQHYADIRVILERTGQIIGSNDLLIAAHSRALGATLITHNLREFERVPGLKIESWLT